MEKHLIYSIGTLFTKTVPLLNSDSRKWVGAAGQVHSSFLHTLQQAAQQPCCLQVLLRNSNFQHPTRFGPA